MACWRDRALCRTRPTDWWDLGDPDANRLALTLCRLACPVRQQCAATDPTPAGVVRAGVAYTDTGEPARVCACGRPVSQWRVSSASCYVCEPRHDTPMPAPRAGGRARQGAVERHADTIAQLKAEGWTDRAVAVRLGVKTASVRGVRRRKGIGSRAPQSGPRRATP